MTAITYSRGRDKFDAHPAQLQAPSFDEFEALVLADRAPAKGKFYIAAPFKANGEGRAHRCKEGALPRAWLAFDLDGVRDAEAWADLALWLQRFRGFAYETWSHTDTAPRLRIILAASRAVDRGEGQRLSLAIEAQCKTALGDDVAKFDRSVYRGEQPCYLAPRQARTFRFEGAVVDVESTLPTAPAIQTERPGATGRAETIATTDPILRHLDDNGMVKCEVQPGRYAIECPCADEHTSASGETSTIYMLPHFGGVKYGKFHCLHDHCADRKQESFIEALGLEPKRVWAAQGWQDAAPRHDREAGGTETLGDDVGAATFDPGGYSVALTRADTIEPEAIRWIWDGWLAAGKFHVLAGVPGVGKSTIALALAATITSGGRWPDGTRAIPGNVLIWSGEDDAADTLVPRLLAMGADRSRIWFVGDVREGVDRVSFDPSRHMAGLEQRAADIDVKLIVVDPVVSAVAGDSHKNAEVRRSLQPLVDLAVRLDCAMVGVTHFSKGTAGRDPTERVTGSLAFAALARIVLVAAKLPDAEGGNPGRILARSKCNIGIDTGGFAYSIDQTELDTKPGMFASRVLWGDAIDGTARELLAEAEQQDDGERSATDEAREWLTELLVAGSMKAADVQKEARQAGISDKALRSARERLGIKPQKDSFSSGWRWALRPVDDAHVPTKMPKVPEDALIDCVGILGDGGHLRSDGEAGSASKVAKIPEDGHTKLLDTFAKVGHLRADDDMIEVEF